MRPKVSLAVVVAAAAALVALIAVGAGATGHCDATVQNDDTIQAAIDDAADGDTVCVEGGTYEEVLDVTGVDSLTLVGAGSADVTIDASNSNEFGLDAEYSAGAGAGPLELDGFTLVGPESGSYGINIAHVDGVTISDVAVEDSDSTGLNVFDVTGVDVEGVDASDNGGFGLAFNGVDGLSIATTVAHNNAWGGLGLFAAAGGEIADVTVSQSEFTGGGVGIAAQHGQGHTNVEVVDSTLTGNDVGVYVEDRPAWNAPELNTFALHRNDIAGNDDGVVNEGAGLVDATDNYWGHASGPSGPDGRTNPAGKVVGNGDTVVGDVDFDPWLRQSIEHPSPQ